ncbi:MAG TPA: flagellar biosynthesis anti-sigma factor FlgM [Terriglobales bacterium]|nr:flagellar biosynthesis anti-sigma factor FlgM [Terriglobales bacterium]
MRVDFTNLGLEPPDKNKTGRTGHSGTTAGAAAAGTSSVSANGDSGGVDQTRLLFSQTRVQSLEAVVLATPEVREERVAPLQQAIADGTYTVQPVKVADAMTSELDGRLR